MFFVYLLASHRYGTLHVGVTNDLDRRVGHHRAARPGTFAGKYRAGRLVHVERFDSLYDAIAREKALKAASRSDQLALFEAENPDWDDRSALWLGDRD